jgi:hypothetical protein
MEGRGEERMRRALWEYPGEKSEESILVPSPSMLSQAYFNSRTTGAANRGGGREGGMGSDRVRGRQ